MISRPTGFGPEGAVSSSRGRQPTEFVLSLSVKPRRGDVIWLASRVIIAIPDCCVVSPIFTGPPGLLLFCWSHELHLCVFELLLRN